MYRTTALALAICLASLPAAAETLKLTLEDVAVATEPATDQPVLNLRLSVESEADVAAFTRARVGEKVDVRVGSEVLTSPVIRETIAGGALQISGGFTRAEAEAMATALNSGGAVVEIDGTDK